MIDAQSTQNKARTSRILVGMDLANLRAIDRGDFSAPAELAIHLAFCNTCFWPTQIRFIYVADSYESVGFSGNSEKQSNSDPIRQILTSVVEAARRKGIPASYEVLVGKPGQAMIGCVRNDGHDLVIIGTRRTGLWRLLWNDSTELDLQRRCPCPVWIAKPLQKPVQSVMVVLQRPDETESLVKCGARVAEGFNAQLTVFHSLCFSEMQHVFTNVVHSESIRERKFSVMDQVTSQLRQVGYCDRPQFVFEYGPSLASLLNYLRKTPADLLVVGNYGSDKKSRLLNRETAEAFSPYVSSSLLVLNSAFQHILTE